MSDGPFIDELKTAGVFGGAFGGAFYALRWLLDWIAKRLDKRQAQLDAQQAALDMSWRDYRLQLERRIATIERQNQAFRLGFQHVSAALIRIDPQNPALIDRREDHGAGFSRRLLDRRGEGWQPRVDQFHGEE
jgi:hypothetical protein